MDHLAGEIAAVLNAAIAAFHGGRLAETRRGCRWILCVAPATGPALSLLGVAIGRETDGDDGMRWLRRACTASPADPLTHDAYGNLLAEKGSISGAAACYRRALTLAPDLARSHYNLGLLPAAASGDQPIPRLKRAATLDPAFSDAWTDLANFLGASDAAGATTAVRKALATRPSECRTWVVAGVVALRLADPHGAVVAYQRGLAIVPDDRAAWINLLTAIHYDPFSSSEQVFQLIRRWARPLDMATSTTAPAPRPPPERKLRIGYLSADLREHVIAYTVEGLLHYHDRQSFEIVLYADVAVPDEVSRRMARDATWRTIAGLTDAEVADLIRTDAIDILVTVAGHTSGNRPAVAALRPAPVSISLYDLSTTGLEAVDAWITDGVLHPEDTREHFTETLLRIPSWYLRSLPASSPPLSPPPFESTGCITFGCFNSTAKLSDVVFDAWARILSATPGSRLVLAYRDNFADPSLVRRIVVRLSRFGVGADRLTALGTFLSGEAHLERVGAVDIALDTFPFNGANTTFDALWMGVPVVTLAGERCVGRMGASILTAIGETSLIASDVDDYVRCAVALAHDPVRVARLRRDLRQRLAASPICDASSYVRSIEAAYRDAWRRWGSRRAEQRRSRST